jgi:phospholipid/cholesterol/gamma-HCH transport system permease protein
MTLVLRPFLFAGQKILDAIAGIGEIFCILFYTLRAFPRAHKNMDLIVKRWWRSSLFGTFTFCDFHFYGNGRYCSADFQFRDLVADKFVGTAACKMILIELGPLLTALVLAGRVGSALAAEIASMREKEELDAYNRTGLDPYRYLALPRFIAFFTMVPCLTIISNCLALLGGWIVSVLALDITTYTSIQECSIYFSLWIYFAGVIKSFVFGVTIFLLGYYHGIMLAPEQEG